MVKHLILFFSISVLAVLSGASESAKTLTNAPKKDCSWCISNDLGIESEMISVSKKKPIEILKHLRESGLCIVVMDSQRKVSEKLFSWGRVEKPKTSITSVSKQKNLMGKTLCKDEHEVSKGCTTIVVASDAPKSTLFHEWLHVRQIERDSKWCALSKKLWGAKKVSLEDQNEIRNKEWDVHKFLWEKRLKLNLDIEDYIAIADETIEEAKARKAYDPDAEKYVQNEKISEELQLLIPQYLKRMRD